MIANRLALFASLNIAIVTGSASFAAEVDFSRDVRPILSDTCFQCHGPDSKTREADLRLDTKEGVFADLGGYRAVEPGEPDESELYRRITSDDPDQKMPPAESKLKLTPQQIALVKEWIEQGASWQQHWSFVGPRRPPLPKVSRSDWCRNPIDNFVLARLDREGLSPSAEADKATLIRRVSLDLTGLPPAQKEIDAFLADDTDGAYERVVDRLFKSPRYAERMAIRWLDAARYADTSGYQNDGPRYMWRWRDWVIDAYNKNMPFDQFTVEQLAGDLLPNATLDQKIATAFNRNHRGNAEGGIIPEEYQVEYVVDRVDTTATVWLGLTMGCARCHDHKYDPISQKEFYQVFAYFNNIPEYGRAIKEGNSPPYIKAPTVEQQRKLVRLNEQAGQAAIRMRKLRARMRPLRRQWEKTLDSERPIDWIYPHGLIAHFRLDGSLDNELAKAAESRPEHSKQELSIFAGGKMGDALELDGKQSHSAGDVGRFGYFDSFTLAAWVNPSAERNGTVVSRMTEVPRGDGYSVHLKDGRIQVNLVKRWLDDSIRVETTDPLEASRWQHVAVTYDGSRLASGIRVYIDGKQQELNVHYDFLNQTFANDEPFRIGAGISRFAGKIDDVRVYDRSLNPALVALIAASESVTAIAALPERERTAGQQLKLELYYLEHVAPPSMRKGYGDLVAVTRRRSAFEANLPTVMVMQEMERPRDTHVLKRGQYNKPADKVAPGVPSVFPPLPADAPKNRLGLARWLVDPANPLTARVAVNRYWQMYFGAGIVATVEDFGSQGARPTHPELLDWLATEFVESGWNVKHMQKLIVMSSTYRQSSQMTEETIRRDPANELLARGPRFRLPAETVRDQALAVSGLLHEKLGGPSVKPYQPAGLWKEIASDKNYDRSNGADLYRRSLYTYWKRTVAPPTMSTFDAPNRETCVVRQTRTNTPLQALALMNDVTYLEVARALAQRMLLEGGSDVNERIAWGFRQVTCRFPSDRELQILARRVERSTKQYRADPDSAKALLDVGEFKANASLDHSALAAYTVVASLILNLDETITKQ